MAKSSNESLIEGGLTRPVNSQTKMKMIFDLAVELHHSLTCLERKLTGEGNRPSRNRNLHAEKVSRERELFLQFYAIDNSEGQGSHFTPTAAIKAEIERRSGQKINIGRLGAEIIKLGGVRRQRRIVNSERARGYFVREL